MSYAVIKTGGKQYSVTEGQTLLIERLPDDVGATVDLVCRLLLGEKNTIFDDPAPPSYPLPALPPADTDPTFEGKGLTSALATAQLLEHQPGPKLRVFKFKPKPGYKRRTGPRQELTRIKITSIKS